VKARGRWSTTSLGCIVSGLAFHTAIVLLVLGVWLVIGLPYGSHRLRVAEQAWSQFHLTDDQFRTRYPERAHSPAALRIDDLARRMGTYLATRMEDVQERHPLDTPTLKGLRGWLASIEIDGRDGPIQLPAAAAETVAEHAAELRQVEDVLLDGTRLDWRTTTGVELSVSLLGLRNVHSLLLARGVLADQRGDRAGRDRALEASWALEESLWARPTMIDRLVGYVMVGCRDACLRRFRSLPEVWGRRVRSPDRFTPIIDSYQHEIRTYCRSARRLMGYADVESLVGDDLRPVGAFGWVFRLSTAPVLRAHVAGYADALRRETERMRSLDPCALDRESYEAELKSELPRWNVLANTSVPALMGAWRTARNIALSDELTGIVLRERALAPSDVRDRTEVSKICPSLTWAIASAAGEVAIVAQGEYDTELDTAGLTGYTITRR